jgi:uncharacterized protein
MHAEEIGTALLAEARGAIERRLGLHGAPLPIGDAGLARPGATFVTLTRRGHLRGCIGTLSAQRSLREDVRENALAAAFRDPRFPPMLAEEWPEIDVEVSLLGPIHEETCPSRAECLARIGPDNGVILSSGARRATFLPQVWEQLPDPGNFIDQLLAKAGLSTDRWPADMRLGLFRVEKFKEALRA